MVLVFIFLGMPAWFSVSTFGTIILSLIGVWYLIKHVFINFEYDDEEGGRRINVSKSENHSCNFIVYLALNAAIGIIFSNRQNKTAYILREKFFIGGRNMERTSSGNDNHGNLYFCKFLYFWSRSCWSYFMDMHRHGSLQFKFRSHFWY